MTPPAPHRPHASAAYIARIVAAAELQRSRGAGRARVRRATIAPRSAAPLELDDTVVVDVGDVG